ncbi:MAG: AAA family ATPase [Saprospiraceae bacterium]
MVADFKNKIKRLELENFTCFGKVAMDFSPGINVFIGENGTGKTHLLKALFMSTNKDFESRFPFPEEKYLATPAIAQAFVKEYYPTSIRTINLIRQGTPSDQKGIIYFEAFNQKFGLQIDSVKNHWEGTFQMEHRGIFIPPQEVLSWFKGFIASYEHRESSIDPTYYFLAKALSLSKLRGESLKEARLLSSELEKSIGVEVRLEGDEFYIYHKNKGGIKAALEATGINKLSQVLYLVDNGSINKSSIIIWDEPEVNLNPKLIKDACQFLMTLANAGCQIFVATHDYLLPYELSLSKEYADVADGKVPDMKFFALYKGEDGTKVEEGATMPDLSHDAIHEGLRQHQSREDRLFQKSLNANT